jgi:hypothetical protein
LSMANPNSMEKSMTSVVVAEIAGGGRRCRGDVALLNEHGVGERGEERRGKVGRPGAGDKEASTTGGGGERLFVCCLFIH